MRGGSRWTVVACACASACASATPSPTATATATPTPTRLFPLPTGDRLFEDLAWDPDAHLLYVSSGRGRDVLVVTERGETVRTLAPPRREGVGVFGVALDRPRRTLWITEAAMAIVPGFAKGDDAKVPSALVALDPASGAVKTRIELAADGKAHALTDLAVTPTGDVLVSDAIGGRVYVARAGASRLDPLPDVFRSPQTPAPRDDHRAYVPDYPRGIALVDWTTGAVAWLTAPRDVFVKGVDGLYFTGDALVAMQNGARPPRVVRFALDAAGTAITGASTLASEQPGMGEPTHGAIVGHELRFLSSYGWSRFDDDGALVKDPPPDAPGVWTAVLP